MPAYSLDGDAPSRRTSAPAVLDFEVGERAGAAQSAAERLRAFAAGHGAGPAVQARVEQAIRAAVEAAVSEPHAGPVRVVADVEDASLEVVVSGGADSVRADPDWSDGLRTIAHCAQAFAMRGGPEVWM